MNEPSEKDIEHTILKWFAKTWERKKIKSCVGEFLLKHSQIEVVDGFKQLFRIFIFEKLVT